MNTTITIDEEAYKILLSLKRKGDSFSKVILRHINRPVDTAGELYDLIQQMPPPDVDMQTLEKIKNERGRRSGGRK